MEKFQSSHRRRLNVISDLYNCDLTLHGLVYKGEARNQDPLFWEWSSWRSMAARA